MLRELSDEKLMEMYVGGEVRAFEILYDRHHRSLFNFILKYISNRSSAEEILQEAFLRVVRGQKSFKRRSKFTTWLYTIARNLCVDKLRRLKHRRHKSLDSPIRKDDEGGQTLLDKTPGEDRGADLSVLDKEIRKKLASAVEELPEDQKEVFLLRETSHLPFKEIAEIVGCPENTVKSRMRYALERLRVSLSEFEEVAKRSA